MTAMLPCCPAVLWERHAAMPWALETPCSCAAQSAPITKDVCVCKCVFPSTPLITSTRVTFHHIHPCDLSSHPPV